MLNRFSLEGKIGIVTGGGTGLGKGMASAVVQAGAEILIAGRRKNVLEEAARELSQFGGRVLPFLADLSRMEDIPKIVDRAMRELGRIDFLFNNAGTSRQALCEEYSEPDWDVVLETNLKGPFFLAQAVAKTMIAANRPGSIINTSSIRSFVSRKDGPAYAASKGGINQITKAMANCWARHGIRVNAIAPGFFVTEMTEWVLKDKEGYPAITNRIPMGRWGRPEELGGVAVFLASDASGYITGQTLVVDGGFLIS